MKVKDYCDMLNKVPANETVAKVLRGLFDECSKEMRESKEKTEKMAITILINKDRKWHLICRRLPNLMLPKETFRKAVLKTYPELKRPLAPYWDEAKTDN